MALAGLAACQSSNSAPVPDPLVQGPNGEMQGNVELGKPFTLPISGTAYLPNGELQVTHTKSFTKQKEDCLGEGCITRTFILQLKGPAPLEMRQAFFVMEGETVTPNKVQYENFSVEYVRAYTDPDTNETLPVMVIYALTTGAENTSEIKAQLDSMLPPEQEKPSQN